MQIFEWLVGPDDASTVRRNEGDRFFPFVRRGGGRETRGRALDGVANWDGHASELNGYSGSGILPPKKLLGNMASSRVVIFCDRSRKFRERKTRLP